MKLLAFLSLVLLGLRAHAEDPAVLTREFIFETAPFASCHATTIADTTNVIGGFVASGRARPLTPVRNGLAAAWFGGTREGSPDVGIWVSRYADGQWTAPVEVATGVQPDGKRLPCWNPVLFQPTAGPLELFYKVGPSPTTWWGMHRTSTDGGQTWSEASRLPNGFLGPIKNKPIELPNGDLLCPTSTESAADGWRVHFERRTRDGAWRATPPLNDGKEIGAIQPSILMLGGERLRAVGRTKQGRLFEIASEDFGATWGKMSLLDLPNPNSGTDAVTLRDGRHLLVYNHTPKGRTPLNVALSSDGVAWQSTLVLESEPGEYSYPAVIQTRDGKVHITYTWKRQRVRHIVLDPAALK